MFKRFFVSLFLIIFIFWIFQPLTNASGNFQYSKDVRNQVIENFKKVQYDYIFSNDDNVLLKDDSLNFIETNNKIEFFEKLKNSAQDKSRELEFKNRLINLKTKTLQEAVDELDLEIENKNQEIVNIENDIQKLTNDIIESKSEIVNLQNEVSQNNKILLDYISYIYKSSNNITTNKDIDSLKTILINSWNLNEVLSDLYYSNLIEVTGQTLIEQHRWLIKKTFLQKINLENTQLKLEKEKENHISRLKEIAEKKDFREKLLTYTKWQQSLYEEYLDKQKDVENNLKIKIIQSKLKIKLQMNNLLKQYNCSDIDENYLNSVGDVEINEEELNTWTWKTTKKQSDSQKCYNLSRILENEMKLQSVTSTWWVNFFNWPVQPTKWLSSYFRDPDYKKVVWWEHDAIDIRVPQWTEIKAPADWYVTFLRSPNDSWYAYVALKHANWFVSVYGHINELFVDKYDYIKAWEVFAKSWWEFWTNWAWPITSGPHLHMEVFKDKEISDPLDYLDLTVLWEKNIPVVQKYVYKYIDDFRLKSGGEEYNWVLTTKVKIFKLEWETEVDRQKYLLNNYASSDFKNWDMWVEEAVYWDIDPSFLMCVWLAESWLWRNLKTWFNVWNIWNTDSWWTMVFPTARSWIYWMVKTLNNKFLWSYQTMDMLSRYWNKDKPIYASSPLNWQTNVKRCLSAIKKEQVPDDYKFRIKKD